MLGDRADFVLADLYPAVRPVQVGVTAGAGLKLQYLCRGVERPDADEGNLEMLNHQFRAALEHGLKSAAGIQGHGDIGIERGNTNALLERFFGPSALLDLEVQFAVGLAQGAFG